MKKYAFLSKYEFSCILMREKQNKTLIKRIMKILLYNIKVYGLFMNFIEFIQKIKSLFLVARQRKWHILL